MAANQARKLFSSGELTTLVGMGMVVISAALVWERSAPQVMFPGAMGEVYRSRLMHNLSGYDVDLGRLKLGWVIVCAAVTCGSLLLLSPSDKRNRLWQAVQYALAGLVFVLAALHIGPYPGVILGMAGSIALALGARARTQVVER